jgi:hypothetical protein
MGWVQFPGVEQEVLLFSKQYRPVLESSQLPLSPGIKWLVFEVISS